MLFEPDHWQKPQDRINNNIFEVLRCNLDIQITDSQNVDKIIKMLTLQSPIIYLSPSDSPPQVLWDSKGSFD
jgi:hypothetical protein